MPVGAFIGVMSRAHHTNSTHNVCFLVLVAYKLIILMFKLIKHYIIILLTYSQKKIITQSLLLNIRQIRSVR